MSSSIAVPLTGNMGVMSKITGSLSSHNHVQNGYNTSKQNISSISTVHSRHTVITTILAISVSETEGPLCTYAQYWQYQRQKQKN